MRCLLAQVVALAVLAAVAASAGARTWTSGVITVGHGARGVELGFKRAQVVQRLGTPNMESAFGTMSYGSDRSSTIFDVYRTDAGAQGTARQFVISSPRNGAFKLQDGNRIFTKGGLRRVAKHYGKSLKFHTFDDGTPYYELVTTLRGRRVLTDFQADKRSLDAYVLDVFIVYA